MGSIGASRTSGEPGSGRAPGYIDYSKVRGAANPLEEDEVRLLEKDKDFNFEVTNNTNSGATRILARNENGDEIASFTLWYEEVEVHNRFTGGEDIYKNLRSALSGVRRRYKNMQRRR